MAPDAQGIRLASSSVEMEGNDGPSPALCETVPSGTCCKNDDAFFEVPIRDDMPCVGAARHKPGLTFLFHGGFGGKPCTILFDTGATDSFMRG